MRNLWWNLPGPDAFLDGVVDNLERGVNVVVGRPVTGPSTISEQIRRRWMRDEWRVLDGTGNAGRLPEDLLIDRFCPGHLSGAPITPQSFLEGVRGRGLLIAVHVKEDAAWHDWKRFLEELSDLARHLEPHNRPLFLVEVIGQPAVTPVREAVAVSNVRWKGVVKGEDMALYAAFMAQDGDAPVHIRRLKGSIVAELALWDPELAEQLARVPLRDLLAPMELLRKIARARSWATEGPVSTSDTGAWAAGQTDQMDGVKKIHSALVAALGDQDEIRRRVWAGQVAILFPLIERLRLKALDRLRLGLNPPFRVKEGVIHDPVLLEIGDLFWLLNRNRVERPDPTVASAVRVLRRMRNALAHLEIVGEDDADHPDLVRLLES